MFSALIYFDARKRTAEEEIDIDNFNAHIFMDELFDTIMAESIILPRMETAKH